MTTQTAQLAQYNRNAILSATPTQLVTMLYDRLVLDLKRAEAAQDDERWADAHEQLLHAQDIVAELSSSLRIDAWDGAAGLFAIYVYVHQALVDANIHRNIDRTREAIALLEPLCASWHQAAQLIPAQNAAAAGGSLGVA
ncbi:flagellar export chaperone FliS [Diaminobutyricibacter tongyongensis]|uniref:Flagellar export chaperone FliS n=1 Tax=Leifsonia tongyongensis TaxID=1268043 RepID=A0A6L9XV50_9MICO|nr:flagellar export chaperone FliS [Diaminobutyricibacter tongyongensis]NEN05176.1 flagellar export chaperone FliS [Diaminobutyricibacter tongyongensis]